MAHEYEKDPIKVRHQELSAMVELSLGEPLEERLFQQLASIQDSLHEKRVQYLSDLEKGKIDKNKYLALLTEETARTMQKTKRLLGEERFYSVFGETGDHPAAIIDPEVFFAQD